MARINELTDQQAAAFGHAFLRWMTDEDPAEVAHFFPELDPHRVDDSEAANIGRSILEDLIAERFLKHMPVHNSPTLSKLSDRGQTMANPADDIRGRKVKDKDGHDVGRVDDLLIDDQDRKVRFLRIESMEGSSVSARRSPSSPSRRLVESPTTTSSLTTPANT